MDPEANNSFSDPFLAHLFLILSIYDLSPSPPPIPSYDGPSTSQTDNILHALKTMARRMYTTEDALASIKASGNWENSPDAKKRHGVADTPQQPSNSSAKSPQGSLPPCSSDGSTASGYSSNTMRSSSGILHSSSSPPSFSPHNVSLAADFERNVNVSESAFERDRSSGAVQLSDRAVSPMAISLDGPQSAVDHPKGLLHDYSGSSLSAPPTPHDDLVSCPLCGSAISDSLAVSKVSSAFKTSSSSGATLVVPPDGPHTVVAFESGMNAVEELRLLKAQISDVVRVCNAVARGDLSHKITVPFQGVFMVQVKDVVNGMVDKLDQFAREVTRVLQEVGAEGYVSSPPIRPSHNVSLLASVNSAVRLLYSISMAYG
jgi:osomolarity two-component system sensor histidine kinase NIK1